MLFKQLSPVIEGLNAESLESMLLNAKVPAGRVLSVGESLSLSSMMRVISSWHSRR